MELQAGLHSGKKDDERFMKSPNPNGKEEGSNGTFFNKGFGQSHVRSEPNY